MRWRTFGRTGVSVSERSFGAWATGGSWREQKESDSTVALDRGLSIVGAAGGHGNDRSERIIGSLGESAPRLIAAVALAPTQIWQDRRDLDMSFLVAESTFAQAVA